MKKLIDSMLKDNEGVLVIGSTRPAITKAIVNLTKYTKGNIRLLENNCEMMIRQKYPERNILSTEVVITTLEEATIELKKTDGDYMILPIARNDDEIVGAIQCYRVGGTGLLMGLKSHSAGNAIALMADSYARKNGVLFKDALSVIQDSIKYVIEVDENSNAYRITKTNFSLDI